MIVRFPFYLLWFGLAILIKGTYALTYNISSQLQWSEVSAIKIVLKMAQQVYFQSFPHPKCVRIEMVNIPNQTFASGWSVGRCPIAANCSPESHFSMEFKLLLNSVTHLSKWDHWTRLVCTWCNKIGMFSSLKMRMFDFFDNRDKCCKPGFLRGNI